MNEVVRVTVSDTPAPAAAAQPGASSEGAAAAQAPGAERPSWLPEKFKSPEDLAKAYGELEKKQGGAAQAPAPATPGANPLEIANAPAPAAQPVVASAALAAAVSEAAAANGVVSAETYAKLEKQGLDRAAVDTFVAGQAALVAHAQSEVYGVTDGAEGYQRMAQWAKAGGMTAAELAAHNSIIKSGNVGMMKYAAMALAAKYRGANGSEANLTTGNGGVPGSTKPGFSNINEQTKAIQDPRYKTDAAYRAEVQDRIGNSNF